MISEDPSLDEIIQHGIDAALSRLFKAGPGTVKAYDPLTNTAFITPGTKRAAYSPSGKRSYRELPEIPFVPVIFPRAGGMVLRLPMKPGDTGLLVYCDEGLAEWRDEGGVTEPQDARLHSMGWPVFIPGFFSDNSPPSSIDGSIGALYAIFGEDGGKQVRVGPAGIEFGPAGAIPVSPIALAAPLMTCVATMAAAGSAGGASDTAVATALSDLALAVAAVAAALTPPNPAAIAKAATATASAGAAATATAASAAAAVAGAAAAAAAGGAVPSIVVRSF